MTVEHFIPHMATWEDRLAAKKVSNEDHVFSLTRNFMVINRATPKGFLQVSETPSKGPKNDKTLRYS